MLLTPEQYLDIERKAERKSEYCQGEMFAMAGATRAHNLISAHTSRQIDGQLRSRRCEVYSADMRVYAPSVGLYTYPDLVIVCGYPQLMDNQHDTLLNPTVIVEVLSPCTEAYDRGQKFERYQSIPTLRQYLLLAQDRMRADLYTRQDNGQWILTSASRSEDILQLESVGCSLSLAECYEKVEFPESLF